MMTYAIMYNFFNILSRAVFEIYCRVMFALNAGK